MCNLCGIERHCFEAAYRSYYDLGFFGDALLMGTSKAMCLCRTSLKDAPDALQGVDSEVEYLCMSSRAFKSMDELKLDSIKVLDITTTNIESIEPLRNAHVIERLYLSGMPRLSTLEPLRGNRSIRELYIDYVSHIHNHPGELTYVIGSMPNLEVVSLCDNRLENIDFIRTNTSLITLHVNTNNIVSLEPLQHNTTLTTLNAHSNNIPTINSLVGNTTLTHLNIRDSHLEHISGIETLHISTLDISGSPKVDFSILKSTSVLELSVKRCELTSFDFVKSLPNLQHLDIGQNHLTTLDPVRYVPHLTSLFASVNKITEVRALSVLAHLHSLKVAINEISSLEGLECLSLHTLDVANNKLVDIPHLESLVDLDITGNKIENVDDAPNLVNFKCMGTHISTIPTLKFIKKLVLNGTRITDLSPLKDLFSLEELHIEHTNIDDASVMFTLPLLCCMSVPFERVPLSTRELLKKRVDFNRANKINRTRTLRSLSLYHLTLPFTN